MMYQTLAPYYDALVQDEEATELWHSFVKQHSNGTSILELACGSGDLAIALAKDNYQVTATDMSEDMITLAKQKERSQSVAWSVLDMRSLAGIGNYDTITCFCDSFNYILDDQELDLIFKQVYEHLHNDGSFLFDIHSLDRLAEFQEEYCEDGYVEDKAYEWTIIAQDMHIYQNFVFYDEQAHAQIEQHVQKVYDPIQIKTMLEACGFEVSMYTDFVKAGIVAGEKYFFVARKG